MKTKRPEGAATFKIREMSSPGRALRFRLAVGNLDGVLRVDTNYILDTVTVKYDADKLTLAQIKRILLA
jgi:copper chaperone CopZ